MGNGWVDPKVQYPAYADFALANGLISIQQYTQIKQQFKICTGLIEAEKFVEAADFCEKTNDDLVAMFPPGTNTSDITSASCEPRCPDLDAIRNFFNLEDTR